MLQVRPCKPKILHMCIQSQAVIPSLNYPLFPAVLEEITHKETLQCPQDGRESLGEHLNPSWS